MTRICVGLVFLFTSVLSYPINKHGPKGNDNFELSNEFWIHHFGPDFQDAVHLNLQQTDLIDTRNNLDKHTPPNEDNLQKKRSAYVLHTPQALNEQNRSVENSMKVHLLEPQQIDSLEKQMLQYAREHKTSDSPIVVNLPATGDLTTKSVEHETPIVLNVPGIIYQNSPNNVHSEHFGNTKDIWSGSQGMPAFDHEMHYQQREPVYDKIMGQQQTLYDKTIQSQYDKKLQPSFDRTAQPSYENMMHPSYQQVEQPSYKEISQPYNQESTQTTFEKMMQPPTENMQPTKEKESEATYETMKPSQENIQPSFEQIQDSYAKMMHPSMDSPYDQVHPTYDFNKQNPFEGSLHPSYENTRLLPYGSSTFPGFESKSSTHETSEQPTKVPENTQQQSFEKQSSFEDALKIEQENRDKTK